MTTSSFELTKQYLSQNEIDNDIKDDLKEYFIEFPEEWQTTKPIKTYDKKTQHKVNDEKQIVTITVGDIKLCNQKQIKFTFPKALFEAIPDYRTFQWTIDNSSNTEGHRIEMTTKSQLFKSDDPCGYLSISPRCISEKTSFLIQVIAMRKSIKRQTNLFICFCFSSSPNGISLKEDDPDLPVIEKKKEDELGSGTEAVIYKTIFRKEKVAVKRFKIETNTHEMEILKQLRHPNVIELLAMFYDKEKKLNVIMPRAIGSFYEKYLVQSDVTNCLILKDVLKDVS